MRLPTEHVELLRTEQLVQCKAHPHEEGTPIPRPPGGSPRGTPRIEQKTDRHNRSKKVLLSQPPKLRLPCAAYLWLLELLVRRRPSRDTDNRDRSNVTEDLRVAEPTLELPEPRLPDRKHAPGTLRNAHKSRRTLHTRGSCRKPGRGCDLG